MCPGEEEDMLLSENETCSSLWSEVLTWLASRRHTECKENHYVASEISNCTRRVRNFIHLKVTFHIIVHFFRTKVSVFISYIYLWLGIPWQHLWGTGEVHTGFWW